MKLAVLGLWHLGCVTAACAAQHFDVVGLDDDAETVAGLLRGQAPLFEPELDELLKAGLSSGRLGFTTDVVACRDADVLWVTFDTPVDDDDVADIDFVLERVRRCVGLLPAHAFVVLSSQLPVGTCRKLGEQFPGRHFACSPENLRLGKAIEVFTQPDRIVVGCDEAIRPAAAELFGRFSDNIVWMTPASAEMTKHAINSFLAVSIAFMNEISLLCEDTGADAKEVEAGLKSERRIGPQSYLSPGGAFAGGTLARDVVTCIDLGQRYGETLNVIPAIKRSNDLHRQWSLRKLLQLFPQPEGRAVALLGLTYKPGTNTLRRSSAVELAAALSERGFEVRAHDPALERLPEQLSFIKFFDDPVAMLSGCDCLVVSTPWPQFRDIVWRDALATMATPTMLDQSRFLANQVSGAPNLAYVTVGSPH